MGGSNPLEPVALGKPAVIGPHHENFAGVVAELVAAGGLVVSEDPMAVIAGWLEDPVAALGVVAGGAGCAGTQSWQRGEGGGGGGGGTVAAPSTISHPSGLQIRQRPHLHLRIGIRPGGHEAGVPDPQDPRQVVAHQPPVPRGTVQQIGAAADHVPFLIGEGSLIVARLEHHEAGLERVHAEDVLGGQALGCTVASSRRACQIGPCT